MCTGTDVVLPVLASTCYLLHVHTCCTKVLHTCTGYDTGKKTSVLVPVHQVHMYFTLKVFIFLAHRCTCTSKLFIYFLNKKSINYKIMLPRNKNFSPEHHLHSQHPVQVPWFHIWSPLLDLHRPFYTTRRRCRTTFSQ